jgi:hypothetical protein
MTSELKWIVGLGAVGLGLFYITRSSPASAAPAGGALPSGSQIVPGNYRQLKVGDFMIATTGAQWRVVSIDPTGEPMVVGPNAGTPMSAGQLLQSFGTSTAWRKG